MCIRDSGGSIRFPSHACGLTGLKPTWGRVSRHGVFALADSLDHVGPMARTAADCAAILAAIAGPDRRDPTAIADPVDDYLAACGAPVSGLRIGLDAAMLETLAPEVAAAVKAAAEAFEALGARILPMTLPDQDGLMDAWSAICGIECLIAHRETWPARKADYGPGLAAVLEGAQEIPAMAVGDAIQRRLAYSGAWETAVQDVDMVLLPILAKPTPSRELWEKFKAGDESELSLAELLNFTAPADMTGHPALILPAGVDDRGGPIGVQLIGRKAGEADLFSAGHAFQTITDWHVRRPDLSLLPT